MASRPPSLHESLTLSRIFDDTTGGYRVLVDRLWPRGVSKRDAALDEWLKDIAPSTGLREWYGHEPDRFVEFKDRYTEELGRPPARQAVVHISDIACTERVTLLTATRDVTNSAARVLLEHLLSAPVHHRDEVVDDLVDGWGQDSFPASDPPGCLPPTLSGSS